jgi:hypothetical protein
MVTGGGQMSKKRIRPDTVFPTPEELQQAQADEEARQRLYRDIAADVEKESEGTDQDIPEELCAKWIDESNKGWNALAIPVPDLLPRAKRRRKRPQKLENCERCGRSPDSKNGWTRLNHVAIGYPITLCHECSPSYEREHKRLVADEQFAEWLGKKNLIRKRISPNAINRLLQQGELIEQPPTLLTEREHLDLVRWQSHGDKASITAFFENLEKKRSKNLRAAIATLKYGFLPGPGRPTDPEVEQQTRVALAMRKKGVPYSEIALPGSWPPSPGTNRVRVSRARRVAKQK